MSLCESSATAIFHCSSLAVVDEASDENRVVFYGIVLSDSKVYEGIRSQTVQLQRNLDPQSLCHKLIRVLICLQHLPEDSMRPRWKGKGLEAKALADPMSKIVSQLQSSLIQSNCHGLLSGCSVLLEVETTQTDLLNRACFGRPIITAEKDKQWFQLDMEEAFYLCYSLNCLKIVDEDKCTKSNEELWNDMKSKRETFPDFFKAYSHLRKKNWVVRSGSQYGVDFVAYRHHPALVHSEYAVLVLSGGDGDANGRLRVWSDFQCTLRLCGSVAKTLLVLNIYKNGNIADSPLCLETYSVEELTITRWSPEQCREDQKIVEDRTKDT